MSSIYEMNEKEKTKDQLVEKIIGMRRKIVDFEAIEIKYKRVEKELYIEQGIEQGMVLCFIE
jgi:hypothetical protein